MIQLGITVTLVIFVTLNWMLKNLKFCVIKEMQPFCCYFSTGDGYFIYQAGIFFKHTIILFA